jgi:hypothetical protein
MYISYCNPVKPNSSGLTGGRSDLDQVIIWIRVAKDSSKYKNLRTPINRKFNDTGSANLIIKYLYNNLQNIKINKIITVGPLFKTKNRHTINTHLFIGRRLRSCTCFWM